MLVGESRVFEVVTFHSLQRHQDELDHQRVLSDLVLVADEADPQLAHAVEAKVEVKHSQNERSTGRPESRYSGGNCAPKALSETVRGNSAHPLSVQSGVSSLTGANSGDSTLSKR